jgi:tetratricopeptide (TPR) repeat protein
MARRDSPGAVVMARKPHVGYFAGMRTAALPLDVPLWRLGAWASEHGVDYLFYSGIERIQRPEYGVLADSAVALPGLEPQAWSGGANGYALYRFNDTPVDSLDFAVALRGALSNYEARHGEDPADLLFVAVQYLSLGDPAAARTRLDRLVRGGAADPGVERMRSRASEQLGDLAGAIDACQRAMALEPATGWHWARMGRLRAQVGDLPGARDAFERAVALEPANRDVLVLLGRTQVAAGDPTSAAVTFERALRLDPGDVEVRRFVAGAWQLAGNEARMRAVLAEGLRAGASRQELAGETRGEEGVTAP